MNMLMLKAEFAAKRALYATDEWFKKTFKDQAGGAEIVATLVIIGIVLALALIFRNAIVDMVKSLWDSLVAGGDTDAKNSSDIISNFDAFNT